MGVRIDAIIAASLRRAADTPAPARSPAPEPPAARTDEPPASQVESAHAKGPDPREADRVLSGRPVADRGQSK